MDVFDLRNRLINDYARYTRSFIKIADPRIAARVDTDLNAGAFWPEPLLQLNPTFKPGGTIDDLVADGTLHKECSRVFRIDKTDHDLNGQQLILHTHQTEAIRKAKEGKSYVLTSGTGSGKSLTYIVPIVDHVLRRGSGNGIQAIVVYPMNALANSQNEELSKFLEKGYPEGKSPVRFARFTGQEKGLEREAIRSDPPDILLTNYMMLELLLTRSEDRELVRAAQGLRFLVLDELHTYRGRQGADVALLTRRSRIAFDSPDLICVGTSATMASGGTALAQKREVAAVAQSLFGARVGPDQVIGETLERATPEYDLSRAEVIEKLRAAVANEEDPPTTYEDFRIAPLSAFIESTFGVRSEPETGWLIRQAPRQLRGANSAARDLANLTGASDDRAARVLEKYLLRGSNLRANSSSRFPIFPFRLHQFLTRGDTIWTTIESEAVRHLELTKLVSKPGEPDKPLFPLVFCRQCGTAYYRASIRKTDDGYRQLEPREDRREDSDGLVDAYLYISATAPWPHELGATLLSRLPGSMKEIVKGVERVRSDSAGDVPEAVFVDAGGRVVPEGHGLPAALIHRNFLFCLEPSCGVVYAKTQRSEKAKLGTLGVDNRSTATTILAVRSLIELQRDTSLNPEARKLLSFTDNRQDASLQAGHFNDFSQVALLRSALHKATTANETVGLNHGELSRAVFNALSLRFEDYAADPDVQGPARATTNDAFRLVIDYYLYRDLQRGWRVTAPNLEDCGLLRFEYEGLTGAGGLLEETALWASGLTSRSGRVERWLEVPTPLLRCPTELREQAIRMLLDIMRRSLAVKVDVLDQTKQLDLVEKTKPRLLEGTTWYLDDPSELSKSVVAYPRSKRTNDRREDRTGLFVSSFGGFGRYIRRVLKEYVPVGQPFGRPEVDAVILYLFEALKRYGILEQVRSGEVPGYQINADAMRWIAGSGKVRPIDRTRLLEVGEIPPEVNEYFLNCYRTFVDLKCVLEAHEHTAQVPAEEREEREERFRTADLPLLFCSPTMELGVDIAQLNLVNLRNVPPTPANYAQRGGRAGRGGQPALVYTYCAGRSPHDQYYFRQPDRMVAGAVAPPQIDLRNHDLVRSHIYAIWMQVATPNLGKTLMSVLDIQHVDGKIQIPVKESIKTELTSPVHRAAALAKATTFIDGIREVLVTSNWFHEKWTKETLDRLELEFDRACDRWRELYRSAVRQRELHHKIIGDHSRPEAERKQSQRLRTQAESQIRLLTEAEGVYEGDFYSYRYFATQGLLPGYNFPRLPLSAYVPARRQRKSRDEFVSRPRFLAISEFGPRALIYHEGARYRVYKVNLDFGTDDIEATHNLSTAIIKRCPRCGYAHLEQGKNLAEVCERCGTGLHAEAVIPDLVQLQNVSLRLVQRITCDEEERQRYGYRLVTSYRFPEVGGKLDRNDAEVRIDGVTAMRLSYGDSTTLYRINLGWASQRGDQRLGFLLDLEKGYWSSSGTDDDDRDDAAATGRVSRVVPYVTDTKNALVLGFEIEYPRAEMAALQAALKEAIQRQFQLEARELAGEAMPSSQNRREILFYESSEGGAGVLRQLVDDPSVMPALARRALEVCHFNPDTLADTKANTCGKACYECLLDYTNQPDHGILDRYLIRDILAELARGEAQPAGGAGSRSERLMALHKRCDSKLEHRWLDLIETLDLRLPSDAQYLVESCSTRPDFFYKEYGAAVFVDGPPHDTTDQMRSDQEITQRLLEAGYVVIRFHHAAEWRDVFKRHPDIFGHATI